MSYQLQAICTWVILCAMITTALPVIADTDTSIPLYDYQTPITTEYTRWSWNKEMVIVHDILASMGLYEGSISRLYTKRTEDAIVEFQKRMFLIQSGNIDQPTRTMLNQIYQSEHYEQEFIEESTVSATGTRQ